MNLITVLMQFNTQENSYNGFKAETFEDVRIYNGHLNALYDEYFNEIKDYIAKILSNNNNPLPTIRIFFDSKLFDFKKVENRLEEENEDIEERRNYHRRIFVKHTLGKLEEEEKLSESGASYVPKVASNLRLVQDYFTDKIGEDVLIEYLRPFEKEFNENVLIPILMEKCQREWIKKTGVELNQLFDFYFPENKDSKKALSRKEKDFKSYLHHHDKDALMIKLHELLDGNKGKVVAITIKALEQLGFMSVPDSRSAVYKAMRDAFGDIGSDQSINPIMNNFTQYSSEIEQQMRILEEVK